MFTGIIEEVGTVRQIQKGQHSAVLHLQAETVLEDLKVGDSVAVNGVCLTATRIQTHGFCADVMHETLNRSSLAALQIGSQVNLERAMAANGRFGGHIVAGHVDGLGRITQVTKDDNAIWYTIQAAPGILRYIVEKGSVAIDGVSLTVAGLTEQSFRVSLIPHTGGHTTLLTKKAGDPVNLENDIIGKYVQRLITGPAPAPLPESRITEDFLRKHGF